MKISFTTLACPDWTWDEILHQANQLGYDGIEIRGVEGEMYLPIARPFLPENIEHTLSELKEKNLEICCLDTSCSFHDEDKYDLAIKEGRATIDLAQKIGTPFIRVFGDAIPVGQDRETVINRIARGLEELACYSQEKGVYVLIETHGDFTSSDALFSVLQKTNNSFIGVLWDVNNAYKVSGEPITKTYSKLGEYIKHIHIKDSLGVGANEKLTLVGKGDFPLKQCIEILKNNGYNGWLSLEWEKKWNPEIEEPEIALPAYIKYIKQLLSSLEV